MNKAFSVGCDPETALVDPYGEFVSAIDLIGGTKDDPRKTKHGFVQEDGALAEFNTNPSSSEDDFFQAVRSVLNDLDEIVKPLDLSIHISPTVVYPDGVLDHPRAREAGCSPDYDAWGLVVNDPPDLSATNMRSLGGHLHIAWDHLNEDMMNRPKFVRVMDVVAGVPSIIMDPDTKRRELYGAAGAHRPKLTERGDPYDGVEYRSLSNFWIKSEDHIRWAFNTVKSAVDRFEEFTHLLNTGVITEELITTIINTSDVEKARVFCDVYNIAYIED